MKKYRAIWSHDGTAGLVTVDRPHEYVEEDGTTVYLASEVEARIAEMERLLESGRVAMRDLWRLDPSELPSDDLAQRCKAFMGGG